MNDFFWVAFPSNFVSLRAFHGIPAASHSLLFRHVIAQDADKCRLNENTDISQWGDVNNAMRCTASSPQRWERNARLVRPQLGFIVVVGSSLFASFEWRRSRKHNDDAPQSRGKEKWSEREEILVKTCAGNTARSHFSKG